MSRANFLSSKKAEYIYLTAFLIPVLVAVIVYACCRVYPLGENCFLKTDMYHQYAPFYSEFREKLQNGRSLLYTWDIGLGVNFTALYAYYLASPLNWLIILCPETLVIEFMMVNMIIKLGLCAVSMTFYLRKHSRPESGYGPAFFGIFYALSGYMCAYYWNLMWLDCIILFPVIMYGFEKLVRGESGLLYAAALGISILSNYYISIMICMFLVFWFFISAFLDKELGGFELSSANAAGNLLLFIKRGLRFAFFSLMAGGLSAVLLLPEICALKTTASSSMSLPKTYQQYFSIADMIARHMPCIETEQALEHWPNIYCGTAVFVLFALYIIASRIKLKEKIVYVSTAVFMLMGFSINLLNFIWHGLHYPNSLPARQGFIYVFLVLFMCYRSYSVRRIFTKKQIGGALIAALLFILYAQDKIEKSEYHFMIFYGAMLIAALYAGLLYAERRRLFKPQTLTGLALLLVIAEVSLNTSVTSFTTCSRSSYTADNSDVRELCETLVPTTDFYRIEKVSRKTKNDGAWLNFPSVSLFSSVANADCTKFFKALGCEGSTNAYSITGSTPFVDMLFSVRYAIYGSAQDNHGVKTFVESRGDSYLYRNNCSLPLGFMMPEAMLSRWATELSSPANVQNSLCDVLGVSRVMKTNENAPSQNEQDYAVTIAEDGDYYLYITNPKVTKVTVTTPVKKQTIEHTDRGFFVELGYCYEGDKVSAKSETDGQDMKAELYRFDYAALEELYGRLSEYTFDLSDWQDASLKGKISSDSEALGYEDGQADIFLSIPYDAGWSVKIDGAPVETYKAFDTFLSFKVPDGTHELELDYMPQGLVPGGIITLLSAIVFAGVCIFSLMRKRKAAAPAVGNGDEKVSEEAENYGIEFDAGAEEDADETDCTDVTDTGSDAPEGTGETNASEESGEVPGEAPAGEAQPERVMEETCGGKEDRGKDEKDE